MGKYFLAIACAFTILFVLLTRESHFEYVNPEPEKPVEVKDEAVTVMFTGDIMMGRNLEVYRNRFGPQHAFVNIKDTLHSVESVIGNLEGPVMDPHVPTPSGSVRFSFASTTPNILKENNIDIVSLANNHTSDFGSEGYKQTTSMLDAAGVLHAGHAFAYGDEYVLRTTIGGKSFVFVAFNLTNPNFDISKALEFVKTIEHSDSDYFVAMVHGGDEYVLTSNNRQKTFYRGLIDADVDTVIAHHPHVTQEIELYKNKPIFYSLGNFIFDQYFEKNVQEGYLLKLTLSDKEAKYEILPIFGNRSQPKLMEGEQRAEFLTALAKRSPTLKDQIEVATFAISRN